MMTARLRQKETGGPTCSFEGGSGATETVASGFQRGLRRRLKISQNMSEAIGSTVELQIRGTPRSCIQRQKHRNKVQEPIDEQQRPQQRQQTGVPYDTTIQHADSARWLKADGRTFPMVRSEHDPQSQTVKRRRTGRLLSGCYFKAARNAA